ncbi:hypothetical protein [Bifidobacterium biavatii]|uniref:Lipoprotein n=1 Tax=Bifidobacterium biavatii DSM 23969 TaxID=1437608 RepID=A0A086ZS42_9BIFI|nr:hypothetical protein [Bifidobacterium biavatii]KFI49342.1 hypothetical protein BBIA_2123 [Bifidobacterium biavatii DSM 23969]
MRRIRGIGVAVMMSAVLLLSGCAGPAAERDSSHDSSQSDSSETKPQGEKLASSLSEYIDEAIGNEPEGYPMDKSQIAMLERAQADGGKVSATDYETAWTNYRQCMVAKGYADPALLKYSNGVYEKPVTDASGLSRSQIDKLTADDRYCEWSYVHTIDDVYRLQVGNAELIWDPYEAAVDCLRRNNLVPQSYTDDSLREDHQLRLEGKETSVDFADPSISSCIAANGLTIGNPDTAWKPLG